MRMENILVEDITTTDPPLSPTQINGVLGDIPSSLGDASRLGARQLGVRQSSKTMKNGNWSNEQLSSTIVAYDNIMSMKQESERFHIPYSSLFWNEKIKSKR
jgi:hypothetical protein